MIEVRDLGLIGFDQAYALQQEIVRSVIQGGPETLLVCEHPAVITMGRMTKAGNVLFSADRLSNQGILVKTVDRGGDVTLHAPGQLVAYPILDLTRHGKDLKKYLYKLEQVAIDFLMGFGILASRFPGRTGVWIQDKKIASLGVGVKKWVSFHGIGINVDTDLELFKLIRPCGMDVAMTSVQALTGQVQEMSLVKERFIWAFYQNFDSTNIKKS